MAIIFFALAFVLILVASFMLWSLSYKNKKNKNWERPPVAADSGV